VSNELIVATIAAAALGVSAGTATAAPAAKKCGNSGSAVQNIQASKTSCSVAKKVARADVQGKRYDGWKCKSKRFSAGANVTCTHQGGGKVTFQVADKP
jgi:hypothetical protein